MKSVEAGAPPVRSHGPLDIGIRTLHRQHPSTWTQELDLRPWIEKF